MEYLIPDSVDEIGGILRSLGEFWRHWGFEPWEQGPLAGVSRTQRFIKDGILGPVAEYKAWDCIVWDSGTEEDREQLWKTIRPCPDTMTQRFVFLVDAPWTRRRIRSFALGFKGYVEFYAYLPTQAGGLGCMDVKDLTGLVDMGMRLGKTERIVPDAKSMKESQ